MTLDKLKDIITTLDQPIEIGFEKEFVLLAKSKKGGEIYNLNLASELIESLINNILLHEYSIKPEYSKCLIEIISAPYQKDFVFEGLEKLNNTHHIITSDLKKLIKNKYPAINEQFEVYVDDNGSSQSCFYLNNNLTIQSDQENIKELVLIEYQSLVAQFKDLNTKIEGVSEPIIGLYNHINSFHITLHPTYKKGYLYFPSYIQAIIIIQDIVSRYRHYDNGNRQLYRNGLKIECSKNIRDIFYDIFLPKKYTDLPTQLSLPKEISEAKKVFFTLSKRILQYSNTDNIDEAYSCWSASNLRPRIITCGDIPAIEIRQFGSNFSKTKAVRKLLKEIINLDTQIIYEK